MPSVRTRPWEAFASVLADEPLSASELAAKAKALAAGLQRGRPARLTVMVVSVTSSSARVAIEPTPGSNTVACEPNLTESVALAFASS